MSESGESGEETNVVKAVRSWLDEQGYPLEMRVAGIFQDAGASVIQSDFYKSDEGVEREVDIIAGFQKSWFRDVPDPAAARALIGLVVSAVVECKSGPKNQKPWIVFSTRPSEEASHKVWRHFGSIHARFVLELVAHQHPELRELPLFAMGERVGYSLATMKGDKASGHDPAFVAMTGLIGAANSYTRSEHIRGTFFWAHVICPALIVDTPIVECWLDENRKIQLRERDRITMAWRHGIGDAPVSIFEVVHERAVATFAADLKQAFEAFSARADSIAKRVEDYDDSLRRSEEAQAAAKQKS